MRRFSLFLLLLSACTHSEIPRLAPLSAESPQRLWTKTIGEWIGGFDLSPDRGRLAVSGEAITVLDTSNGSTQFELEQGAFAVAFSPDGSRLAAAGSEAVVWELKARARIGAHSLQQQNFSAIGWLDPDRVLAGLRTSQTTLVLPVADMERATFTMRVSCDAVVVLPSRIILAADGKIWTVTPADDRDLLHGFEKSPFIRIAATPHLLAGGTVDGHIVVWELGTDREVWRTRAHESAVRGLAFSPDGAYLAECANDGVINLWEVRSGGCVASIRAFSTIAVGAAWRDLRTVIAASAEGEVAAWDVSANTRASIADLSAESAAAHGAMWALVQEGDKTVRTLERMLRPPRGDAVAAEWIDALESPDPEEREQALGRLVELGWRGERAIRQALLLDAPGVEAEGRLLTVLRVLIGSRDADPDALFRERAIATLERIGSVRAQRLLALLAIGSCSLRDRRSALDAFRRCRDG